MKHINEYVKRKAVPVPQHGTDYKGTWHCEPIEEISPVIFDDVLLERGCHREVRRYDQ